MISFHIEDSLKNLALEERYHKFFTVVNNQIGIPTYTYDLVRLLVDIQCENLFNSRLDKSMLILLFL